MQPCAVIRNWHVSTFCVFVAYSFFRAILFSCVILIGYCWRSEIKVVIDKKKKNISLSFQLKSFQKKKKKIIIIIIITFPFFERFYRFFKSIPKSNHF